MSLAQCDHSCEERAFFGAMLRFGGDSGSQFYKIIAVLVDPSHTVLVPTSDNTVYGPLGIGYMNHGGWHVTCDNMEREFKANAGDGRRVLCCIHNDGSIHLCKPS